MSPFLTSVKGNNSMNMTVSLIKVKKNDRKTV